MVIYRITIRDDPRRTMRAPVGSSRSVSRSTLSAGALSRSRENDRGPQFDSASRTLPTRDNQSTAGSPAAGTATTLRLERAPCPCGLSLRSRAPLSPHVSTTTTAFIYLFVYVLLCALWPIEKMTFFLRFFFAG